MHDLDRTLLEIESTETSDSAFDGLRNETSMSSEGPLSEADELELAAEVLEARSDEELEEFLGGLLKKVKRGLAKTGIGSMLGDYLKGMAKTALPMAGQAVGSYFGGPLGGQIGSKVAGNLGSAFGLELEGLSPQDQEFEAARNFVKFAADAAKVAGAASPNAAPRDVVRQALTAAAQRHAPGLLRSNSRLGENRSVSSGFANTHIRGHSGTWIRRGNTIILRGI